jgi:hypothetical protein
MSGSVADGSWNVQAIAGCRITGWKLAPTGGLRRDIGSTNPDTIIGTVMGIDTGTTNISTSIGIDGVHVAARFNWAACALGWTDSRMPCCPLVSALRQRSARVTSLTNWERFSAAMISRLSAHLAGELLFVEP